MVTYFFVGAVLALYHRLLAAAVEVNPNLAPRRQYNPSDDAKIMIFLLVAWPLMALLIGAYVLFRSRFVKNKDSK